MSYYQKYRPDKISELDLVSAKKELEKILGTNRIAHAYLFVGPRGSGKTSAARILAKVVNCKKSEKKFQEPCGECDACVSIKKQAAVDVIEIDAASHRGIDDIRDLREKVKLAPVSLRKKVYIIDEVHMLTNEAFNALLKTLEEPPEEVMFILCTTEDHKVPETIASRCVKVIFSKASKEEIKGSLLKAVKGEKLEIEAEALELLAGSVDGSFREGHKILEQLAQDGKKITVTGVESVLGLIKAGEVSKLVDLVMVGEQEKIVEKMTILEETGTDALALTRELLEYLQNEVRRKVLAGGEVNAIEKVFINGLIDLTVRIKNSPLPLLPIELFLLEMAQKSQGEDEDVVEKGEALGKPKVVEEGKAKRRGEMKVEEVTPEPMIVERIEIKSKVKQADWTKILETWPVYLANLAPRNHSVAGLLRSARPKGVEGKCLTIEVFYKFHKEQLEQEVKRRMLEEEAARLWGVKGVKYVLGEREKVETNLVKQVENVTGKVDDEEVVKVAEEIFGG